MKGEGRLPVKDSAETCEGLIFIKMTDPHVWYDVRSHDRVIQLCAVHQLVSTCVKNGFTRARVQKRAAPQRKPGSLCGETDLYTCTVCALHHRRKNTNSVMTQGNNFFFFFFKSELSQADTFKRKRSTHPRITASVPDACMAAPPMTTQSHPQSDGRGSHVLGKRCHSALHK